MNKKWTFYISGTLILITLTIAFCPGTLHAQVKTFAKEFGSEILGIDSTESARAVLYERAKGGLLDDVTAYLLSHTEVKFSGISGSDARALISGLVRVESSEETCSEKTCKLRAAVRTDLPKLVKSLEELRRDRHLADVLIRASLKARDARAEIDKIRKGPSATGADPQAKERYHRAVRNLEAVGWLETAVSFVLARMDGKALDALSRAIELNPAEPLFYGERSAVWQRMGEDDKALEDYGAMIALHPRDAAAYVSRGNVHARLGRHKKAMEDYDRALKLDPANAEGYFGRGLESQNQGLFADAIRDYHRALELKPGHKGASENLAAAYAKLGIRDPGISYYDGVLKGHPGYVPAYLGRGIAFWKLGKDAEAIKDFERVLELRPGETRVRRLLFITRGRSGDREGAIAEYLGIYERDLTDVLAYGNPETAYGGAKDFKQVSRDFHAAFKISPKNIADYLYRGIVRMESGDYEQAIRDFASAAKLDPQDARPCLFRGIALGRMGNFAQAARFCGQAVERKPGEAAAYAVRGIAYDALRDKRQSFLDLRKAMELGHRGAREALRARGY